MKFEFDYKHGNEWMTQNHGAPERERTVLGK